MRSAEREELERARSQVHHPYFLCLKIWPHVQADAGPRLREGRSGGEFTQPMQGPLSFDDCNSILFLLSPLEDEPHADIDGGGVRHLLAPPADHQLHR